jgi:mannitol/fructose-specific phosphotransferase system IIA component (Ntr-type)
MPRGAHVSFRKVPATPSAWPARFWNVSTEVHVLLSDLLTPECVRVPLQAGTKDALLQEMVALLDETGALRDGEDVLRAVQRREDLLSTGIGSGVAIPHGKAESIPHLMMAAGVTRGPVDFDALDGEPVRLVFLLVGPEVAAGPHVKALSRISRLVRRDALRSRLVEARSPQEFLQIIQEAEADTA